MEDTKGSKIKDLGWILGFLASFFLFVTAFFFIFAKKAHWDISYIQVIFLALVILFLSKAVKIILKD